jgi:hypothetical protein
MTLGIGLRLRFCPRRLPIELLMVRPPSIESKHHHHAYLQCLLGSLAYFTLDQKCPNSTKNRLRKLVQYSQYKKVLC